MPDNVIIKDRHIGCSAANVNKHNTGFFFFLTENSIGTCQWFQVQVNGLKSRTIHTLKNILYRAHLSGNDMKIAFKPDAGVTYRIFNARFTVDDIFLRDHMNYLLAGTHYKTVHVVNKLINI